MAVSNQDATQAEELQKMLGQVSVIKTKPDADLPYLIQLETMILQKLREPFQQNAQAAYGGGLPSPGVNGSPMPQGLGGLPVGPPITPGPGGAGVGPTPGGGVPGVMSLPQLPPADQLRRILSDHSGRK